MLYFTLAHKHQPDKI